MDSGGADGKELFFSVLNDTAGMLLVASAEVVLALLAFIFIALGCLRLWRRVRVPGARHLMLSWVAYMVGALAALGYSMLMGDEGSPWIETLADLYLAGVTAIGAYGFLRVCNAISAARTPKAPEVEV